MSKSDVSGSVSRKVEALLERLTDCWSGIDRSRDQLAEVLCEIRTELANDRKFSWELNVRGIPRRTAYDLMDDWKWLQKLKPSPMVREMARKMKVTLTAERYRESLTRRKLEIQGAATEEEAKEILDGVKTESKRKPSRLSEDDRRQKDRDSLLSIGCHLLAGMTEDEQVSELEQLVRKLLPAAEIDITRPTQKMKVVPIGA